VTYTRELRFRVDECCGEVSALLELPRNADRMLVIAHGAGAGMRHTFLESLCTRLAARDVASFRYQFPYMEAGHRAPSPRPVLLATVRSAVETAAKQASALPLLAGGKSMGGRMTSLAASGTPLPGIRGIVFLGFPLHAPGRPSSERGEHLQDVAVPMLFLQGTRDRLADLGQVRPLCRALGDRATLHVVEGGDHSFKVPKRSSRTDGEALDELSDTIRSWNPR
jgi:hypothetical protein